MTFTHVCINCPKKELIPVNTYCFDYRVIICYTIRKVYKGGHELSLTFYWYPNCGTCKKAKKWLDEHELDYTPVHIVEETPSKETLLDFIQKSNLAPRKFFNTSGKVYREQHMKDKIKDASTDEMASYLASDGMLIKRPILTDGEKVTVGFKEEEFAKTWLSS